MSVDNISAVSGLGSFLNPYMNYTNQVMFNDFYNDSFGCYNYMNPMMSMNGSLFSGITMPYMPNFTGSTTSNTTDSWMQQMDQWQDYSIDRQVRYQEKSRSADLRLNSPMEGIQDAGKILNEKIHKDEQEQIIPALTQYVNAVKAAFPNASDEDIMNRAKTLYEQQFKSDLVDDIRSNGKDALTQGFLQAVSFGLADNRTAEENIAEITGQQVGRNDQTKKVLGRAAGGAVIGGAAAYLLSFSKCFKFLGKSKPLLAAAAGAVIAGLTAINSGKNTQKTSVDAQSSVEDVQNLVEDVQSSS